MITRGGGACLYMVRRDTYPKEGAAHCLPNFVVITYILTGYDAQQPNFAS